VPLKNFFHIPESKFRRAAVLSSLGLGLISLFLFYSITSALFDSRGILAGPGRFFVQSYGLLALIIPGYLAYAAVLLADPRYRPDRIFVLSGVTLPFITLALGFFLIRNFDARAETSPFIARAGKTGISFIFVILTTLESLIILFLKSLLFGRAAKAGREANPPSWQKPAGLLPPPKPKKLKDIYAEAAALYSGSMEPPLQAAAFTGPPAQEEFEASADIPELEDPPEEGDENFVELEEAADLEVIDDDTEEAARSGEDGCSSRPGGQAKSPAGEKEPSPTGDGDVEKALADAEAAAAIRHGAAPAGLSSPYRKKRRGPYSVPVEGILNQYPDGEYWIIDEATRNAAVILKETLKEFNIQAEVTGIKKGPVITMFEILPAPGVKLSKIVNLQDNIALRLAASSVRIVAPIPGKHAVGIEVPNARRNIVSFREIIENDLNREGKKAGIPVVLGKDITGEAVTVDLATMPHLLIAGATGAGKSVCVNSMILSVLYQEPPADCRLILIDPKIVELKLYNDIPHLLTPVITEPKRAFQALQYCIYEMERRYACLDSMGVRDIKSYNKKIKENEIATEHMPYIVVVIDEFADLMATTGKELESTVARLAAMSRAVGIHLVLATQRPSIDVITGLIKANIPSRIAFMVASKMDSRIIIDMVGAEKLLGKGDMLYAGAADPFPVRLQGAFISEEEVERVVDYVKTLGEPDYIDDEIFYDDDEDTDLSLFSEGDDPLYEKALEIVVQQGKASASYIQRRLKIGYNRAARLVELMEHNGVVGPAQGSKPRELLRAV
jgi:S-DNA-T family DNA segregation ATPase FtsK/SpoIIIE